MRSVDDAGSRGTRSDSGRTQRFVQSASRAQPCAGLKEIKRRKKLQVTLQTSTSTPAYTKTGPKQATDLQIFCSRYTSKITIVAGLHLELCR